MVDDAGTGPESRRQCPPVRPRGGVKVDQDQTVIAARWAWSRGERRQFQEKSLSGKRKASNWQHPPSVKG